MYWFDMLVIFVGILLSLGILVFLLPNEVWECVYTSIFERDSDERGNNDD